MREHNQLSICYAQHTDAGVKNENQDFHGLVIPNNYQLESKGIAVAIADGVSASEHGREASEAGINCLLSDYYSTPETWTVKTSVSKVLNSINRWLLSNTSPFHYNHYTHATTLSALILKSNSAHLFHIGDSRIYRMRENQIDQLTNDHRVYVSKSENYLKRALGIDPLLEIDYKKLELQVGDIFILTTDGIHDTIDPQLISKIIESNSNDLDTAAHELVQRSIKNNSSDNLTCQIIRIITLPNPDTEEFYEQLTKLPFPPDLETGQIIDHYKVIRQIHASSRSQCYYVTNLEDESPAVLKTPSINFIDDPQYIKLFLQEEWIGKHINNPHVLKMHELKRPRTFMYQVAEYIEGKTLRDWMNTHANADIHEVIDLVRQIGMGLRAFHRLEMVHRDLKPENIMIDKHNTVRIIDFGSTKISGELDLISPIDQNHLVGTLSYAAPEYARGDTGSPYSDQYSLAIICYEMLCGNLPFRSKLNEKQISNRKYMTIRHYRQNIPIWLEGAIRKALNENPADRYGDIDEFVYELKNPNPNFKEDKAIPLIERDPVKYWKILALSMIFLNIILIYILNV